ncbi:WG repeat-containing protein [Clostridium perfringens]|uniref:WG repeat-containing protein n=1 Tax=Clostridium perfringens TaxID=1502 RepID=UPI001D653289|nr:WG repeat-containing protein [Clostridium perfringens]EHK2407050.1 WG repeat-containing protein [Clostridium perfringens]MDZ5048887.1 WG repeat-containing protein [Clostridium perfringens]
MRLKNICFMAMATILCTSVLTGCGTSSAKEDSDNELYIITEDKSSISLSNSKPGMFGVTEDGEIFMEKGYEGKVAYIDKKGKKSIGFKFDKGSEFSYGMAGVKEGNTYKIINKKGKTLVEKEDGVLSPLNNNLIRYEKLANEILTNENTTEAIESLAQSGKTLKTTGILNTKGEVIVEPGRYDEIIKDIGEGYILVKKNKMYGLLNAEGNEIIPCEYTSIGEINEGFIPVSKGNLCGALNEKGEIIVPIEYFYVGSMNEGVAPARLDESGIGFLNKDGSWAIMPDFDGVTSMNNGVAFSRKDNKHIIIDKDGKELETKINFENKVSINGFSDSGLAVVDILDGESKYMSIINTKGEEIKNLEKKDYSALEIYPSGLIVSVNQEGKKGLLKEDGSVILEEEYNDIRVISKDVILVDKDGTYSYIDSTGKTLY